jgi:glycosyltransferase involved in cell wall biosynthesis
MRNYLAEWLPSKLADRVVVLSEGSRYQYLIRNMVEPSKIALLPNCFDPARRPTSEAAAAVRALCGWSPDHLHVLSEGRLADQKKVEWLLESWAAVQRRVPAARLWILGDGPERRRLEELAARLGLASTVSFLGFRDDAPAYVLASDLVAMTTLYEGHANVPLEAMACGRPIVASDVDGVRESFTDGEEGFLVPPGDTALFAERLIQLLEDGALRERMGAAALRRSLAQDPAAERNALLALLRSLGMHDAEGPALQAPDTVTP